MINNIVELKNISNIEKHLNTLADYHVKAVPKDFMPALGNFFLKNVLYKGAIKSDNANVNVYMEDNVLAGYIIYSYDTGKFLKEIFLKRLLFVVVTFIIKIMFNYKMLIMSFKVALSILKEKEEKIKSEILMIVVNNNYRGRGIGGKLLQSMYDDLSNRGFKECKLRVLNDNFAAIRMYEKGGWEKVNEIEFLGRKWLKMKKELKI